MVTQLSSQSSSEAAVPRTQRTWRRALRAVLSLKALPAWLLLLLVGWSVLHAQSPAEPKSQPVPRSNLPVPLPKIRQPSSNEPGPRTEPPQPPGRGTPRSNQNSEPPGQPPFDPRNEPPRNPNQTPELPLPRPQPSDPLRVGPQGEPPLRDPTSAPPDLRPLLDPDDSGPANDLLINVLARVAGRDNTVAIISIEGLTYYVYEGTEIVMRRGGGNTRLRVTTLNATQLEVEVEEGARKYLLYYGKPRPRNERGEPLPVPST